MGKDFIVDLVAGVKKKKTHVCVGLDPDFERIPGHIKEMAINEYGPNRRAIGEAFLNFNREIITAVKDSVAAVKIQIAWFEEYGRWGLKALEETISFAHHNRLLTILDIKRGDIGSTAAAYARGFLGEVNFWYGVKKKLYNADAVTLNPYLGRDSLEPFIRLMKENKRGGFVLVKTSNPGSKDLQDLRLEDGELLYEKVGAMVNSWGQDLISEEVPYSQLGAVTGATFPQAAQKLRELMPHAYLLVPGFGAQGAGPADVVPFFNEDGLGALINASRSIIFAYEKDSYPDQHQWAARQAAEQMRQDINKELKKAGRVAWE